jgi:hypothetical protein
MTTELLREAARLMRERAEDARDRDMSEPWKPKVFSDGRAWVCGPMDALSMHGHPNVAKHIASWPPIVALAVADMLDDAAENAEMLAGENRLPFDMRVHVANAKAIAVARAYLGSAA